MITLARHEFFFNLTFTTGHNVVLFVFLSIGEWKKIAQGYRAIWTAAAKENPAIDKDLNSRHLRHSANSIAKLCGDRSLRDTVHIGLNHTQTSNEASYMSVIRPKISLDTKRAIKKLRETTSDKFEQLLSGQSRPQPEAKQTHQGKAPPRQQTTDAKPTLVSVKCTEQKFPTDTLTRSKRSIRPPSRLDLWLTSPCSLIRLLRGATQPLQSAC